MNYQLRRTGTRGASTLKDKCDHGVSIDEDCEKCRAGLWPLLSAVQTEADDFKRITARTLVLIGDDDLPAIKRSAVLISRWTPNSQRKQIPGVGHLCMLEAPDVTAALIREHLT